METTIIHKHVASNTMNIAWISLISTVIGGLLVWAGQYFERVSRKDIERRKDLREIYAFCRMLEAEMKNNYRELAMAKVHVEYWWHCCNSDSTTTEESKCYIEHLRSQSDAREIERRIGETKAKFIAHVRKFQIIKDIPKEFEVKLVAISELKNPRAKRYSAALSHEIVKNDFVEKDEDELRNEYYKNLEDFKHINDKLQQIIAKK